MIWGLHYIDIAVIFLFLCAIIGIGLFASRGVHDEKGGHGEADDGNGFLHLICPQAGIDNDRSAREAARKANNPSISTPNGKPSGLLFMVEYARNLLHC